jgi:hypothetical protein
MDKRYFRSDGSKIAIGIVAFALLYGCESTSRWMQGSQTEPGETIVVATPETNTLISEMYELTAGDPATQAEIYADARAAAELTPNPSTRLRYGLVLATPGHSGSDPLQAQHVFRELLAQTELMTPGEISLTTIHLKEVESRIMLAAETDRLRAENSKIASTEQAAVAQRLATVESENRRLRRLLEEAESKLEALSAIEQSIREQDRNGER